MAQAQKPQTNFLLVNDMEQNCSDKNLKDLKVALVHYWLVTWRGGEKVIKAIMELFPNVDIYTIFLDEDLKKTYLPNYTVYPSVLNKIGFSKGIIKRFSLFIR